MAESLDSLLERSLAGSNVSSTSDALVVGLHSKLLSEGFECVALGDENFGVTGTRGSEVAVLSSSSNPFLPTGWNDVHDAYTLQYRAQGLGTSLYLVKLIPLGESCIISALSSSRMDQPFTVNLSLPNMIHWREGQAASSKIFQKPLELFSTFDKEIVSKLKQQSSQKQAASSKPRPKDERHHDDPLRVSAPRHGYHPHYHPQPMASDPFAVGGGDLSPFGTGGGMLMDPFRQGGRFGGGLYPPGPRFDPVAPFGPGSHPDWPSGGRGGRMGGRPPDPDHLPLPGYDDDMFS